ncbi:MAG: hypothetical protein HKN23_17295 [Verrucomicrobiales bacterium]|nr:hypothetical protein [Verrucomicrobiales bacterium]
MDEASSEDPDSSPDPSPETEDAKSGFDWKRWLPWIVSAVIFTVFLPLFWHCAQNRAEKFNSNLVETSRIDGKIVPIIFHYDQHVYMNTGRLMKRSGYTYVVPRHRTPGYPFLLSLLYDADHEYQFTDGDSRRVSDHFFKRAKLFNIIVSIVCIIVLFLFVTRYVSVWFALLFTWSIGWFHFIFRAPFVQPEVLFTTLGFIGFVLMARQMISPTWTRGVVAGVLMAAAFIIKAAILPLVALFCACFALKFLWELWGDFRAKKLKWKPWFLDVAKGIVVPVFFFALLSPYMIHTWKKHGNPIWSVHSQHFMWLEDREEKHKWRLLLATIEEEGKAPEDAPSKENYFKKHTYKEFIERSLFGAQKSIERVAREYRNAYRFLTRRVVRTANVVIVLAFLAAIPAIRRKFFTEDSPRLFDYIKQYWFLIPYFGLFCLGYAILYGAYQTIGAGPRLFLSMYPAVLFSIWLLIDRLPPTLVLPIKDGIKIPGRPVFHGIVALCLLLGLVHNFSHELYRVIGAG